MQGLAWPACLRLPTSAVGEGFVPRMVVVSFSQGSSLAAKDAGDEQPRLAASSA